MTFDELEAKAHMNWVQQILHDLESTILNAQSLDELKDALAEVVRLLRDHAIMDVK